MFCPKCGYENSDSSNYCYNCGTILQQHNSVIDTARKPPFMEAISFTEHPAREQTTINMHQKMGWSLKSSQKNNLSATEVKLIFERDKNMPNYGILKEKYDRFCSLAKQIEELEASVHKVSKKTYFACLIPGLIICLILFFTIGDVFIFKKSFFGDTVGIEPFGLLLFVLICGISAFLAVMFTILIVQSIMERKKKKIIAPKISELYSQMEYIANEAERYLY